MARPVVPVAATGTRPARVLNGLALSPAAAEPRNVATAAVAAWPDEELAAGDVAATATM